MVSGDQAACEEASRYAPEAGCVITKRALARFTARLRPAAEVRQDLTAATETAMKQLTGGSLRARRPDGELCAEIEFSSENCAQAVSAIPDVHLTGSRSVRYSSHDTATWYRCLGAIWTLARSALGESYG